MIVEPFDGRLVEREGNMAIDPICGMQVDPDRTPWKLEQLEPPVYFCARGCLVRYASEQGIPLPADLPPEPKQLHSIGLGPPPKSCCSTSPATLSIQTPAPASCCGHDSGSPSPRREIRSAYFCPCCPSVEADRPGDCPHCGMPLQANPAALKASVYLCPMHPEVRRAEPGSCPICGMELELSVPSGDADDMGQTDLRRRLLVAGLFTAPLFAIAMGPMLGARLTALSPWTVGLLQLGLSLPVVTWAAWPLWLRAIRSVMNAAPNMFTLVALGTWSALGLSLVALFAPGLLPHWTDHEHGALYFESAAVIVTLVLLGQWLETGARRRVQSALQELLKLRPTHATLVRDNTEQQVALEQLRVGDVVRVKPGERVSVDGLIVEGASHIDESMVSGEPLPVSKANGDSVIGGTINGEGTLLIQTRATLSDSLLARIIDSVAAAQRSRAPIQKLADQVSAIFVPVVVLIAFVAAITWLVWGTGDQRIASAAVAAISVLLIACPCALGLATPVSIMVGVGQAARAGILIKQGTALQTLSKVDCIVLDKTGTVTVGKPTVIDFIVTREGGTPVTERELLAGAAAVEQGSEHPLAKAIVSRAIADGVVVPSARNVQTKSGAGIEGVVAGTTWKLGTRQWLESQGLECPLDLLNASQSQVGSEIFVAREDRIIGLFVLADRLKPTAKRAIQSLERLGCEIHLASGDRENAAREVADQLGIKQVLAPAMPEAKQQLIARLKSQGRVVAMVGDGINDAPSLAAADVGIAMGTGTDVAIETADVSLVSGDPQSLAIAIELSRGVMTNIRQNLFFAFAYNAIGIPIAAGALYPWLGWTLSPMWAAAAMSLSSVSVIGNALRLKLSKASQ